MGMPGRKYTAGSEYRYGFNGQERDGELNENIYAAEFWEYDSRIGRRWNLDPKPTIGFSDYCTFLGNPIWFNDIDGDTPDEPDPEFRRGKKGDKLGGTKFKSDDVFSKYFGIGWAYPTYVAQALNFAQAMGGIIEGTSLAGRITNDSRSFKNGSKIVVRLPASSEIITGTIKILKDVYKIDDAQLNKLIANTSFVFTEGTDYSSLFYSKAPSMMLNKGPLVGTLPPTSAPIGISLIPPVNSNINTKQGALVVVTSTISQELAAGIAQVYKLAIEKKVEGENNLEKAQEQLEGIEIAQQHHKETKVGGQKKQTKINSIRKSEQRLKNALNNIKSLKDVQ